MLCFRSEAHVRRWCEIWQQPFGEMFPLQTAWQLARAWYGQDRRDPAWCRFTPEEGEAIFARFGLTSDFWKLR